MKEEVQVQNPFPYFFLQHWVHLFVDVEHSSNFLIELETIVAVFADDMILPVMDLTSNITSSGYSAAANMPSYHTHFHTSPSFKSFTATIPTYKMGAPKPNVLGPSTIFDPSELESMQVCLIWAQRAVVALLLSKMCDLNTTITSHSST